MKGTFARDSKGKSNLPAMAFNGRTSTKRKARKKKAAKDGKLKVARAKEEYRKLQTG
jgi:hypothetical protein